MRRITAAIAAVMLVLTACGDDSASTTTGDDSGGSMPARPVTAFVESVEFLFLESYPVQVKAIIRGTVPTPCHVAEAEVGAVEDGRIGIDVSSRAPADAVCAQVIEPFELTVDVGSFETGEYVVVIDGVEYPFTI